MFQPWKLFMTIFFRPACAGSLSKYTFNGLILSMREPVIKRLFFSYIDYMDLPSANIEATDSHFEHHLWSRGPQCLDLPRASSLTQSADCRFKCSECPKLFARLSSMKKHLKQVHTDVESFECPYCPMISYRKDNHAKHLLTHTGERNFPCSFCSKRFARQDSLTNHLRIHTGERPFHCNFCPRMFTRGHLLKAHLIHHEQPKMNQLC